MSDTRIKAGQFFGVVGHGTDGYFLMTNADGSMSWAEGGSAGPSVTSVDYPGDDTAADPAGNQTVVLTGTNFGSSMTVSIGGTTAPSVAHDSSTQLTITTPAKAAGDYDIVVSNTVTGASGTFVNGISYNGVPTWTTATGSLGTFESETTISTITLQATEPDGGTITFNITNGSLPTGLSLTGANIDGTTTAESSTTLYSFTIEAIDDENQSTPRNFSITVNSAELTPSENFTINTYTGNGSTQSIEGKIGTAASFNGSSSKIILPNSLGTAVGDNNFSVSFWVYVNDASNDEVYINLSNPYQFYVRKFASGNIYIELGGVNGFDTGVSLGTGWHHIAVTKSSSAGLVLYIDNSANTSSSKTANLGSGSFDVSLGGYNNGTLPLDGKIDQVRIFNKVLSSSEVTTLYGENNASSTKSTTDIFDDGSGVALYEFEEGAKDTGGVNGYIGAAGVFNGSSSVIDLPDNLTSAFNTSSDGFTISFFWYNNNLSGQIIPFYFIYGASVGIDKESSGNLRVLFNDGTTNKTFNVTNNLTTGTWQHIVVTGDSTNGLEMYIDKSRVGGTSWNGNHKTSSANYNVIGHPSVPPDGKIDQFRVFNRWISSNEVDTLEAETYASSTKSTTDIFDDGSGVALYELEGNANDTGGGASGYIGSGAIFKATSTSDGIVSGYAPSDMDTTSYTFSQFLFFDNINDEQYIFSNFLNSSGNYGFYAIKNNNVGTIMVDLFNTSNVNTRITSTALSAGQWYHLALTWNHSTKVMKLYIDGALDQTSSALSGTVSTNSNTLEYGRAAGAAQNDLLVGKLDQIRIFNAELDQPKIQELADEAYGDATVSTVDFGGYGGVALYELEGNANDTGNTYNSTSETNISYKFDGTATNVSYAYDGTPTDVGFLGTSFQPDFVWIKTRTDIGGSNHFLFDSIRGATYRLFSNLTNSSIADTDSLTSFDSNGFTVGDDISCNGNGESVVAWCWKAGGAAGTYNIDGTGHATLGAAGLSITGINGCSPTFTGCSVNSESGFGIYEIDPNFTASDHRADFTHGLNSTPQLIFAKVIDGTGGNWWAFTNAIDGSWDRGKLHTTDAFIDDTLTGADNATDTLIRIEDAFISTANRVIFYAFASVDGYQKVGSYSGGSTSTKTTGFKPRFLLVKQSNSSGQDWHLFDSVRGGGDTFDEFLKPNTSDAESSSSNREVNFTSDGFNFSATTSNAVNTSGNTYIYLAIA